MELEATRSLALAMMTEYGLIAKGWSFAFDRAKSRLGATKFHIKTITLSPYVAAYSTEEQIRQTMLHEIAHALLPPEAGHGAQWKALAARIGYRGARTSHNPYMAAMHAAGTAPKRRKTKPKRRVPVPPNPKGIRVGIGTVLKVPKNRATVFKKGRSRWHARTVDGKVWTIPFEYAHVYVVD